jgi:hypothetical protein
MKRTSRVAAAAALAAMLFWSCASSGGGGSSSGGYRTLDAVVTDRRTEAGPTGQMTYYLGFEAKDGDATAHLVYEVTRDQYLRNPEGTHVKLSLADNQLREIRRESN